MKRHYKINGNIFSTVNGASAAIKAYQKATGNPFNYITDDCFIVSVCVSCGSEIARTEPFDMCADCLAKRHGEG